MIVMIAQWGFRGRSLQTHRRFILRILIFMMRICKSLWQKFWKLSSSKKSRIMEMRMTKEFRRRLRVCMTKTSLCILTPKRKMTTQTKMSQKRQMAKARLLTLRLVQIVRHRTAHMQLQLSDRPMSCIHFLRLHL